MARQPLDPLLRQAAALVYVDDLDSPVVTGGDAHHLLNSLRLRPGELIAVGDGRGGYRGCRLAAGALRQAGARRRRRPGRDGSDGASGDGSDGASGDGVGRSRPYADEVRLELETPIRRVQRAQPAVTVGLSLAKGDRTEWAVAKLVEIGVDCISPLVCDRTVVRPSAGRPERLERVAREAAMQSRRLYLPEVSQPRSVLAVVEALSGCRVALAEQLGDPPSLECPVVLVGPEGGWSPAEQSLDLPRVSLGETVLRIETAAVVVGALLAALRDELVLPGQGGTRR